MKWLGWLLAGFFAVVLIPLVYLTSQQRLRHQAKLESRFHAETQDTGQKLADASAQVVAGRQMVRDAEAKIKGLEERKTAEAARNAEIKAKLEAAARTAAAAAAATAAATGVPVNADREKEDDARQALLNRLQQRILLVSQQLDAMRQVQGRLDGTVAPPPPAAVEKAL